MRAKKTILILSDWFLPGYLAGGPIQSIATLTSQLRDDIEFKIITTDRDFKAIKAYDNIIANHWTIFEGRTVFYISPENMNPNFLLDLIKNTPHDAIYLNSLYSKFFAIYPLRWKLQKKLSSKLILAPRGMLRDGALAVKPFKKQLFLLYARFIGLFKNLHWQSTSLQETSEIKKRIGDHVHISQVSNLPVKSDIATTIEKKEGSLNLIFIARIVDIKNLNFAISILKEIKHHTVIFDIYGPKEDLAYWEICKNNAKELPENIHFNYKSILSPQNIGATIAGYHALFLPTQTENFGHIIVETLQNGRPVIISNQTPWLNLQASNVGFDIALTDREKFVEAINTMCLLNQVEYDKMTYSCINYIQQKLNLEEIKEQYLTMFSE